MYPAFPKINSVRPMMTYNTRTKFQLNRIHCLNAIVFIHIHTYTHTYIHHHENNINEFRRPQNISICHKLKVKFLHDMITILSLHSICSESNYNKLQYQQSILIKILEAP